MAASQLCIAHFVAILCFGGEPHLGKSGQLKKGDRRRSQEQHAAGQAAGMQLRRGVG